MWVDPPIGKSLHFSVLDCSNVFIKFWVCRFQPSWSLSDYIVHSPAVSSPLYPAQRANIFDIWWNHASNTFQCRRLMSNSRYRFDSTLWRRNNFILWSLKGIALTAQHFWLRFGHPAVEVCEKVQRAVGQTSFLGRYLGSWGLVHACKGEKTSPNMWFIRTSPSMKNGKEIGRSLNLFKLWLSSILDEVNRNSLECIIAWHFRT
jgi:hypothetical protein